MVTLHLDFETRSPLDIKKVGGHVYAENHLTQVLCLGFKVGTWPTAVWVPEEFRHLRPSDIHDDELADFARTARVVAHNAGGFERHVWTEHMAKRRGFPEIPISRWDDTAARAAMCALPRSLDGAATALGLLERKDEEGYKLMLKMSKPRPLTKAKREALASSLGRGWDEARVKDAAAAILRELKTDPRAAVELAKRYPRFRDFYSYHLTESDFCRLCEYCMQDVNVEVPLDRALPQLPPEERRVWELDQAINDRGVEVDLVSARLAESLLEKHQENLTAELARSTGGKVQTASQVAKMSEWLRDRGFRVGDLTSRTVSDMLAEPQAPDVRRVLEIRQSLSKTSTAKLPTLRAVTCLDGRMRGSVLYHGAATGRWTGRGFQPQNLPRGNPSITPDLVIEDMLPEQDPELVSVIWGDPLDVVSSCLRGFLVAGEGKVLAAADYSAIEGRGLAYLAGEEHVLNGYRQGLDPYKVAAASIYGVAYENITKLQRQVGKTSELACGYQGGEKALVAFGADRLGLGLEERQKIVYQWRASRQATVRLWAMLEKAAFDCVQDGKGRKYRGIKFRMHGNFLQMILPSGRALWYFAPRISMVRTPWGEKKEAVTAMTVNSMTKRWERRPYHGGLWVENLTQAFCRDILVHGLFRVTEAGYPVVLHVHDEIVAEILPGQGSVEEMSELMSEVPPWAEGMPIKADGWEGKRYRK